MFFNNGSLESLNFSDDWKKLYTHFSGWSPHAPLQNSNNNNCLWSCKNPRHIDFNINGLPEEPTKNILFNPNNHSTPKRHYDTQLTIYRNIEKNNSTVDSMSFSTTYPNNTTNSKHQHTMSNNLSIDSNLPTISETIDTDFRHKFIANELNCEPPTTRRVKRRSLKGVRCMMSLALTDDPLKKRTQIQACSITIMILAIIIISFALVLLSSHKHIPIAKIQVPISNYNFVKEATTLREIIINKSEEFIDNNMVNDGTTYESNDINQADRKISETIEKIKEKLKTFPKVINKTNEVYNPDCEKCLVSGEFVCMLNEKTGFPFCKQAKDIEDPSGCGGLCALETEACHVVDKKRNVHECRILNVITCAPNQWRCNNGLCVDTNRRCDGRLDCYDKSDEQFCICDLSSNFHCGHTTSCIAEEKKCDGNIDCWDGFDEHNCTDVCSKNQFTCKNGECIKIVRFCDGYADCSDKSDEPEGCDLGCARDEFKCYNNRCISDEKKCDGIDNCGDNSDEFGCS